MLPLGSGPETKAGDFNWCVFFPHLGALGLNICGFGLKFCDLRFMEVLPKRLLFEKYRVNGLLNSRPRIYRCHYPGHCLGSKRDCYGWPASLCMRLLPPLPPTQHPKCRAFPQWPTKALSLVVVSSISARLPTSCDCRCAARRVGKYLA